MREGGESRRSRGVRGREEEGVKSAHEFAACEHHLAGNDDEHLTPHLQPTNSNSMPFVA